MEIFSIGFLAGTVVTIMGVLYGAYLDKGKRPGDNGIDDSDSVNHRKHRSMDVPASYGKRR